VGGEGGFTEGVSFGGGGCIAVLQALLLRCWGLSNSNWLPLNPPLPPILSPPGTCEELAGTVASQATAAGFKARVANLDSCVRAAKGGGGEVLPKSGAVLIVSSTYNGTPPDNASSFAKWLDQQQEGEGGWWSWW